MHTLIRPTFHALTLLCAASTCLVAAHTVSSVADVWLQPLPSFPEDVAAKAPLREELPTPLALASLERYLGLPDKLRQKVIPEGPGDDIVPTSLGLKLLGTLMTAQPSTSFASVYENPTHRTRSVWTGDELLGARVIAIERTRVLLLNGERLEAIGPDSAPRTGDVPPSPAVTSTLGASIRQVGPNAYELSRREVTDSTANLHQLATQVRIVPFFKDGAAQGFKLFSIRPDSLFARLGLRNGDVLQRINGLSLESPDRAFEAYNRLRDSSRIELEVERNGQVVHQTYTVQD